MERERRVEDISGGEEEAEGGDSSDATGETGGETGGAAGEEKLEKGTDGFEVRKVKNGKSSKKESMKKEKHYGLPLIHSIDRIDLIPISTRSGHGFTHFEEFETLKPTKMEAKTGFRNPSSESPEFEYERSDPWERKI